ncbi:MAG: alanine racemase [bacterium]|nr:alanine racemase [bacterium]
MNRDLELEDLQTPALLIHLDRVRHNLATMRTWLKGNVDRWRPHVKTSKVPEVLAEVLELGVRRFKCATTREAEVLLDCAATRVPGASIDLLFAMAQHGAALSRIRDLAARHSGHRLAALSEHPDHAALLADAGLGVFIDLDPGYHRTGIPLAEVDRIRAVQAAAGNALRGLHCYDGHLHVDDPEERRRAARAVYSEFVDLARQLDITGELVTSGTPTFPDALFYEGFADFEHTVSPGTVVYWDGRSEELGIEGFGFAVEVLGRVVSRPTDERFTVDAGSKALDAAAGSPCALLTWPVGVDAEALTPSEEHLPFRMTSGPAPAVGTLVRLVPRHVCPTVNLADDAVLLEGDKIVGVVAVAARGHETLTH